MDPFTSILAASLWCAIIVGALLLLARGDDDSQVANDLKRDAFESQRRARLELQQRVRTRTPKDAA